MKISKALCLSVLAIVIGIGILIYAAATTIYARYPAGNTDNVTLTIHSSIYYSDEEIQAAMDCVKKNFQEYADCTLLSLRYDDAECISITSTHAAHTGRSLNNMITLRGEFTSGKKNLKNPYINANTDYIDYVWVLERIDENEDWYIFTAYWGLE